MSSETRPSPARPSDGTSTTVLRRVTELASDYLASLGTRRVGVEPGVDLPALRARIGGPLPKLGQDPVTVIETLAAAVGPGLVASSGPRFFGFVFGGNVPASLGSDWLTSAWDQNAVLYAASPAAAVIEDVTAGWVLELLRLPPTASVGFTTGATMANFTGLAAGRHSVLRRVGWDVEDDGLQGAPTIRVLVGADAHTSLLVALRYAGFGRRRPERIPSDDEGRMDPVALAAALADRSDPTIVCAQLGEVNTGACDSVGRIVEVTRRHPNAWLHVDGAFGLWAAASDRMRHLVAGHDGADSWATDAHKWLNVPYDAGIVVVRDPAAHRAAMSVSAAYLPQAPDDGRDPGDWVPELSRRARAVTIHAAIRELGATGIAALVDRTCELARRMAGRLADHPGVRIANEVVLNQVLAVVGDAVLTDDVVTRVQADGTAWLGATTFHGERALRISVSGWMTEEADIDASAAAILRCVDDARTARAATP